MPVLHTLCASENVVTQECAKEILAWLKGHVTSVMQVLLRMLKMKENFALRSNVGVALIHLCLGSSQLKSNFLEGGGLDAVLEMLRSGSQGHGAAMEVLYALEPLITAEEEAKRAAHSAQIAAAASKNKKEERDGDKERKSTIEKKREYHSALISEANFNNPGTCDVIFTLVAGTESYGSGTSQTLSTFHAHRQVLKAGRSVWFDTLLSKSPSRKAFEIKDVSVAAFQICMKALYFYPEAADAFENEADPESAIYEQMKALVAPLDLPSLCSVMKTAHRFRLRQVVVLCATEVRKKLDTIGGFDEAKGSVESLDLARLGDLLDVTVACADSATGAKGYGVAMSLLANAGAEDAAMEKFCKPLGAYLRLAISNLRAFY